MFVVFLAATLFGDRVVFSWQRRCLGACVNGGGDGAGGGGGVLAKKGCECSRLDKEKLPHGPGKKRSGFEGPAFARRANALPLGHIPGLAS